MKAIKIILAAIVVGAIGFFVFQQTVVPPPPPPSTVAVNPFVQKIKQGTDSLKTLSDQEFSKSFFNDVQAELYTFYKGGYLGNDSIQNKQEYINLSKTIFAVYVPKLIAESYYKFKQSSWKKSDLTFIRKEIKEIKENRFFDSQNSGYLPEFADIDRVISKYYEIVAFITDCNSSPTNLNYSVDGRFPKDEIIEKIAQSKKYLISSRDNAYVINVISLRDALKEIPHQMYEKNCKFLKRQIQENSGKYKNGKLASQADYSKAIYQPLKHSLDEFDHEMYEVNYNPEFVNDYNQLKKLLDDDNNNAREYFQKKWDEEMRNKTK